MKPDELAVGSAVIRNAQVIKRVTCAVVCVRLAFRIRICVSHGVKDIRSVLRRRELKPRAVAVAVKHSLFGLSDRDRIHPVADLHGFCRAHDISIIFARIKQRENICRVTARRIFFIDKKVDPMAIVGNTRRRVVHTSPKHFVVPPCDAVLILCIGNGIVAVAVIIGVRINHVGTGDHAGGVVELRIQAAVHGVRIAPFAAGSGFLVIVEHLGPGAVVAGNVDLEIDLARPGTVVVFDPVRRRGRFRLHLAQLRREAVDRITGIGPGAAVGIPLIFRHFRGPGLTGLAALLYGGHDQKPRAVFAGIKPGGIRVVHDDLDVILAGCLRVCRFDRCVQELHRGQHERDCSQRKDDPQNDCRSFFHRCPSFDVELPYRTPAFRQAGICQYNFSARVIKSQRRRGKILPHRQKKNTPVFVQNHKSRRKNEVEADQTQARKRSKAAAPAASRLKTPACSSTVANTLPTSVCRMSATVSAVTSA